jgi:D-erythro-7,8-dihydroneopterin triphosphate epimerase
MGVIRISNLRLRAVVGTMDWERSAPQDVVFNIELCFDHSAAAASDDIDDTVDYKALKLELIEMVEKSEFRLLERLAAAALDICLARAKVERAVVRVDKPKALRFADSVSVEVEGVAGE